eukprot:jgi/Tetstr1/456900/TSEL_043570.t1
MPRSWRRVAPSDRASTAALEEPAASGNLIDTLDEELHRSSEEGREKEQEYGRPYEIINLVDAIHVEEHWQKLGTEMRLRVNIKGDFWETFELQQFPFDMQDLIIQLPSNVPAIAKEGHTSSPVSDDSDVACILVDDDRKPSTSQAGKCFPMASIWDIQPSIHTRAYLSHPSSSGPGTPYPHLWAKCFRVPLEDLVDRFSVNLALLLTLVAYKLVIASSLPEVNYPTQLVIYSTLQPRRTLQHYAMAWQHLMNASVS